MTVYTVEQGRSITLLVEWLQYLGGPASPVTGVTVEITPAGGGTSPVGPTSAGVSSPSTGINAFTWSVPVSQAAGDYLVIWRATDGDGDQVPATDVLTVTAMSAAGPTLTELKRQLNRTDSVDDVELQMHLDAAIEAVENIIGGPIRVTTVTETQRANRAGVIIPFRQPLRSVTSVSYGGSPLAPTGYKVDSSEGTVAVLGYRGTDPYTLVYEAGPDSLPASTRLAVLIITQHLWRTQHGAGRVRQAEDVLTVPGLSFAIPSRAVELLRSSIRPVFA
ncbi:head-tail connector protein [Micromonospora aurantiaca (nom. illeg.)]|uniref:head-tail connector protein n=1 Tax=Micromonospora aurantiaca (nom. illeg.) TaxID=47850 RepID=UPI003DA367D7